MGDDEMGLATRLDADEMCLKWTLTRVQLVSRSQHSFPFSPFFSSTHSSKSGIAGRTFSVSSYRISPASLLHACCLLRAHRLRLPHILQGLGCPPTPRVDGRDERDRGLALIVVERDHVPLSADKYRYPPAVEYCSNDCGGGYRRSAT